VYVLVAEVAGLPPAERDWLARWEEAIALYRGRRFEAARRALEALRAERPDDAPVALYLERTAELCRTPPPAEWDGIHELHEK
jgi:adenylate cyclase